jgi:hypothetical protein
VDHPSYYWEKYVKKHQNDPTFFVQEIENFPYLNLKEENLNGVLELLNQLPEIQDDVFVVEENLLIQASPLVIFYFKLGKRTRNTVVKIMVQ